MDTRKTGILRIMVPVVAIIVGLLVLALWGSRNERPGVIVYTSVDEPLAGKYFVISSVRQGFRYGPSLIVNKLRA